MEMTTTLMSHVDLLGKVIKQFDIKHVLEFGCGDCSTVFMMDESNIDHLTSVEMNNQSWYNKLHDRYIDNDNYDIHLKLGTTAGIEWMNETAKKYDLIFVDGHGDARPEVINDAVQYTDLILAHDTQQPTFRWYLVKKLPGWKWIDVKDHFPWTSVYTNRQDVIDFLENK